MKIIGIIPARMSSSRFPGKPLALIKNKPMLQWVIDGVKNSKLLDELIVATCDKEILEFCNKINCPAVLTKNSHERASDRTQEAVEHIEKYKKTKFDIVVMIQGDEPMINEKMIDKSIKPLIEAEYKISNLMQIMDKDSWLDPGEVKVVVNTKSEAVYFSREPIPSNKKYNDSFDVYKQVCIIPFKRSLLDEYSQMKPTNLEIIESVDMLRLVENNIPIKMVLTNDITFSVDTKEDLKKVEKLL